MTDYAGTNARRRLYQWWRDLPELALEFNVMAGADHGAIGDAGMPLHNNAFEQLNPTISPPMDGLKRQLKIEG